jgi:hypothetical protein
MRGNLYPVEEEQRLKSLGAEFYRFFLKIVQIFQYMLRNQETLEKITFFSMLKIIIS